MAPDFVWASPPAWSTWTVAAEMAVEVGRAHVREPVFEGAHRKLERAKVLYGAFRHEAETLLADYQAAITRDRQTESCRQTYSVGDAPAVPDEWGAVIGDILHNLRAALDHAAWALVLAEGGIPKRRAGSGRPPTQFPIHVVEPPEVRGFRLPDVTPGLSTEVRRVLEEVQPYGFRTPQRAPLYLVAELNNVDKHVGVIPAVNVRIQGGSWSVPSGLTITRERIAVPVEPGAPLAAFCFDKPFVGDIGASFDLVLYLEAPPHSDVELPGDLSAWLLGVSIDYVEYGVLRKLTRYAGGR